MNEYLLTLPYCLIVKLGFAANQFTFKKLRKNFPKSFARRFKKNFYLYRNQCIFMEKKQEKKI